MLAFMRAMNEGFPAVETMTAPEARAVIVSRRLPIENFDDVASADDRLIPGPAGDLPVRIYDPHGESSARPAVVFCHGGGFVLCDLESHDGFCRAMARHTESVVISVDYRLAPEHLAPAAAQDVFAAFCWVVAHAAELGVNAERVLIAGDSAGGNLAAVTALQCREHCGPMPAGQVLIYPVIDPTFDTSSYQAYASGYVNTRSGDAVVLGAVSRRLCVAVTRASGGAGSRRFARRIAARGGGDRGIGRAAKRGRCLRGEAARGESSCGASRLPGSIPWLRDNYAVRGRGIGT